HDDRSRRRARVLASSRGRRDSSGSAARRCRRRRSLGGRHGRLADEDAVEGIGSSLVLGGGDGGGAGLGARGLDGGGGLARVAEALADEAGDDADLLGGAVAKVLEVVGDEGRLLATVETSGELDAGVRAGAKVASGWCGLAALAEEALAGGGALAEGVGGVALGVLGFALTDAAGQLARVGGVGAGVVLNVTRAAKGGTGTGKGVAVDREGAVTGTLDDGRGSAAEGASEGLNVVAAGLNVVAAGLNVVAAGRGRCPDGTGGEGRGEHGAAAAGRRSGLHSLALIGVRGTSGGLVSGVASVTSGVASSITRGGGRRGGRLPSRRAGISKDGAGRSGDGQASKVNVGGLELAGALEGRDDIFDGGLNLVRGGIEEEEALGEDAADGVIGAVAGLAGGGPVIELSGDKGATLERQQRIAADEGQLLGQSQGDGLVACEGARSGGILVLGEGADFRVDGLRIAADEGQLLGQSQGDGLVACEGARSGGILVLGEGADFRVDGLVGTSGTDAANGAGVALEGLVDEGSGHAADISHLFGVGEGLVSSLLLEACQVGDLAGTFGSGSVTEEAEDRIRNALGVVEVEELAGDRQEDLMRVLLRDLALENVASAAVRSPLGLRRARRSHAKEAESDEFKLHFLL
ncbi:hypothetical protein BN1708_009945, partial [Verticillium longisporum]